MSWERAKALNDAQRELTELTKAPLLTFCQFCQLTLKRIRHSHLHALTLL